jgi:zinc finger protein
MSANQEEEKKQGSPEQVEEEEEEEVPERIEMNLVENVPTPDIESLCMNCKKSGMTRFMYMKVPFFKEIMLSAFSCDHCGFKNSETQFAGKLEDYGVTYEVNVINNIAFNRTVVKSEYATIRVPECGLELPP